MPRLTLRSLCLAALALGLAACSNGGPIVEDAPDRTTPDAFPDHSLPAIRQSVAVSLGQVRSYAADGRVRIVTPDREDDATFSLRSRLADSSTVKVRGPLGIEVARAVVTPDSFVAFNKFADQLLVGRVEVAERYVPGTGSSEVLSRALAGLLVPDGAMWSVTPGDSLYTLVSRRDDGTRRVLVVDPAIWRVVQAQEIDASNSVVADQVFSEFDTVEGVVMPRRVVLTAPDQGVRITLEHRRLVLNPEDLRLQFRRPSDAEVVVIR